MSKDVVKNFSNETIAFARSKNNTYENYTNYNYYLNSFEWFLPWLKNFFLQIAFIKISILVILFHSLFFLFNLKKFPNNIKNKRIGIYFFIFLFNLIYWLIAPDIRFGYALFICLTLFIFSICISVYIKKINEIKISKTIMISIFLVLISLKNIKYQFYEDVFLKNRSFNYSNISLYKKINDIEIYKKQTLEIVLFFSKICVYSESEDLEIVKKANYIFIKR